MIEYGLHPTVWRKIRTNHSGLVEVSIKDRNGIVLGKGIVSRYINTIFLDAKIEFKKMSITRLINETKNVYLSPFIQGNEIPIGISKLD